MADASTRLLAQATALAIGRSAGEVQEALESSGMADEALAQALPHRVMPGNRPSTILLLDQLDPASLGRLLVLYEHAVFVSSVIWNINAFDQWGVEYGKILAGNYESALESKAGEGAPDLLSYVQEKVSRTGK